MVKPMTKKAIIDLFKANIGVTRMMSENQYHINTKQITFEYDGEPVTIHDVSFLGFTKNGKVWFNDEGFEMEKIPESPFLFSTKPTQKIHPLVQTFFGMIGLKL